MSSTAESPGRTVESGEVPPERPAPSTPTDPAPPCRNHPADVSQTEGPVRTIQVGDIIPTANGPCELYQDADGRRYLRPIPVDGVVPAAQSPPDADARDPSRRQHA